MIKIAKTMLTTAAMVVSISSYGAPDGMLTTKFKGYSYYVSSCSSSVCIYASNYDDVSTGKPAGYASAFWTDMDGTFHQIFCEGPAYTNTVTVSPNNGNSTMKVTLDPGSGDCSNVYNVFAPLTIDLVGTYDGNYRNSQNGKGSFFDHGTTYKYNSQFDYFQGRFTGFNGFTYGNFAGSAQRESRTQFTRVN